MKKLFIIVAIVSFHFLSCDKDEIYFEPEANTPQASDLVVTYDYESNLKLDFAKALGSALNESLPLREFLKSEALKMFDRDYDVLYHLVKDEKLSSGETFRNLLLSHFADKNRLSEIEDGAPLLTIFIPELPEDSFSAKIWNTQDEIPQVAIRMRTTNHVPIISNEGEEYVLEAGRIPAFPVIVIKDNERVVLNTSLAEKRNDVNGSVLSKNGGDLEFRFLDDVFNGTLETNLDVNPSQKRLHTGDFQMKVVEAYNIYKNADGWQRDYVYYDLTPNNTKGEFSFEYQERITNFRLIGDPMNAYNKISDQTGDPELITFNTTGSFWTGGFFEFKVRTLINAKNGIGSEIITYFPASPDQLFDITYSKVLWFYMVQSIDLKTMYPRLPIINWDLNQYASSIKVEIEEVDLTVTTVINDTRTVKFATNFAIEGTVLKKIGLKFGASLEITTTHSIQKTFTEGNDQLGSVIINFADDVIIGTVFMPEWGFDFYESREYPSGWYSIALEPWKVQ